MNVLGIETSCDETSVALLSDGIIKANLIASQHFHVKYGGVVPELSSRAHLQMVTPLVKQALQIAEINVNELDVISATAGPGLIGALLVGLTFGKGLAFSLSKKFIPVNHIEGHIYSGFLMNDKPEFPYLCLAVSGGHTLLLLVEDEMTIRKLGTTIDDAAGEAFDKVAKMLGLGYPGGPNIQKYSEKGNADAIKFPVAQLKTPYDFSFSGLKTSVLRYIQNNYEDIKNIPDADLPDIAASFQKTVSDSLIKSVKKALKQYKINSISLVGGVAANKYIRDSLAGIAEKHKKKFVVPDIEFCGDNGAMIAYRAMQLFKNGKNFGLNYNAYPSLKGDEFI
ncbi:MAG: tRNA (adenosine(37)-N6)-threonylcarbamoyltransferase complex transferase subunit TsaD [Ignavibacteriae bacterium HGW-Ignavibacteriae-2]|jgi:N6-L-threonylcarbamoyladenine synthase|nr:MAG: tRNA (adenosine(37)-N6)-threonylcarbamoyltransferase complex transferase subunit TsaD [Ignavibacteriae bacterium HGW-Ignavibacteriae-2]